MKKVSVILCVAALLVAGCAKEQIIGPGEPEDGNQSPEQQETVQPQSPGTPLQIDLQIGHGGSTKAVKTGWEAGDMVMVFFPGLSSANKGKYLTVVYAENEETGIPKWEANPFLSTAPDVEDLESSGPMTALFLPYGKGITASWDETENKYVLSRLDYAYFLRAENATYTVENSTLKGTLDIYIPAGYVQFFIPITPEDPANAEAYHDEGAWYTLRQEHLIPTCASGIASDGSVITEQLAAGESIDGFDYAGGYQFSAVLTAAASGVRQDYLFTLTNNSLSRHFVLFRPGKTFTGGKAARLPAVSSWQEYVDLGLTSGLKWAACNVGASKPGEYGDYFAWGDTKPYYEAGTAQNDPPTWKTGKEDGYDWSSYKYRVSGDGSWAGGGFNITFNKYCTDGSYWESTEPMDNKTVLDPEDDAARENWGGKWRMPTDDDWTELITECDWTWTTLNGVKGSLFTSNKNSKTLFLPAAGSRDVTDIGGTGSDGYYWSSSLDTDDPFNACYVYFDSSEVITFYDYRCCGFSVRPVTE